MQSTLSKQTIKELYEQRMKHFDELIERLKLTEDQAFKKGLVDEYMIHANSIDKQIRDIELRDQSNQPYINPIETELERKKRFQKMRINGSFGKYHSQHSNQKMVSMITFDESVGIPKHTTLNRKTYKTIRLKHSMN